jgi:hypothetical protein
VKVLASWVQVVSGNIWFWRTGLGQVPVDERLDGWCLQRSLLRFPVGWSQARVLSLPMPPPLLFVTTSKAMPPLGGAHDLSASVGLPDGPQ